jgi:WXG100 family type VII secretion target
MRNVSGAELGVSDDGLSRLADDLHDMQAHLDTQVRRMGEIVDSIAGGWQGQTATAYRELHRGVAEDAVRIRGVLELLEEATRLSRNGFTEQELDVLERFRRIQHSIDAGRQADALNAPDPAPGPASTSRLNDL